MALKYRVPIRSVADLRAALRQVFDDATRQAATDLLTSEAPESAMIRAEALTALGAAAERLREETIETIVSDLRARVSEPTPGPSNGACAADDSLGRG